MPTTRRSIADEDRADVSAQALLERIENLQQSNQSDEKKKPQEWQTRSLSSSSTEKDPRKPLQKPKPKPRAQKPPEAKEAEKLAKAAAKEYENDVDVLSLVEEIESSGNSQ
ncbi:hypothetical protein QAD02_013917 [Eretmocerus hayati]|uniref:Uncharacterized protein n=1 Tax=Eretmocerus hayati TaxID=131215 RepID=A0ACC2P3H7_9HYME|nr:hypothetical protein QAD02_013917 [Eretmocerus hayati]